MRLDVILPTYTRHQLLKLTLDSLLAAEVPPDLTVSVTVVDNNSSDATRETVEAYQAKFGKPPPSRVWHQIGRAHV